MKKNSHLRKAVFLDRDGVLNRERGDYTYREEDFIVNDGVFEALKHWQDKGYLLIIISNQSGIAKGVYGMEDVENLHRIFAEQLGQRDIVVDEFYYCPHHPDHGNCLCRKPGGLLVEKAVARFGIDTEKSVFIGDRERDIAAGASAGIKGIQVERNSSLLSVVPLVP